VVTLPHTFSLYEALPEGQLAVVPGASHGLPLEQPDVLASLIRNFLAATEPPRTFIPVRRARHSNA
jgi:pimeloyl-ACP methyl ester carboxylesterase